MPTVETVVYSHSCLKALAGERTLHLVILPRVTFRGPESWPVWGDYPHTLQADIACANNRSGRVHQLEGDSYYIPHGSGSYPVRRRNCTVLSISQCRQARMRIDHRFRSCERIGILRIWSFRSKKIAFECPINDFLRARIHFAPPRKRTIPIHSHLLQRWVWQRVKIKSR